MKNFWVSGFLSVLALAGCAVVPNKKSDSTQTQEIDSRVTPLHKRSFAKIKIGEISLNVEVVKTPGDIELGLSYRDEIGADGMLFYLPRTGIPRFWMKGMKFGLDMVWVYCESKSNCVVRDISEEVPVSEHSEQVSKLEVYSPSQPVNVVLEIPSGKAKEYGFKAGDVVVL